jgi:hypothetical protein
MASGRITIPVGLETREVAKGAKDAEKALEKLEDAVGDTGKSGAKDLDKIEDELKDVQKESKKAAKEVDKVGTDGFSKAGQASGEFKQEAFANFSEVTSSFDGSMSSIQDLAQGTLGGLATSGLPGIGIAAGLAAGAVGLIGAEFVQRQEQADELKKRISDMYLQAVEDGESYLTTASIIGDTQDLIFNPDRADELARVMETQEQTGLDLATIYKANAGDLDAIKLVQSGISTEIDKQIDKNTRAGEAANYSRELQDVEDHWNQVATATDEAKAKTDAAKAAALALHDETVAKSRTTRESLEAMWKTPVPGTVKLTVDDSAVKNWHAPLLPGTVQVTSVVDKFGREWSG